MFSFPEIANNQFMPYRERYFVCLLLLSWHIFDVTLAFYMGDGAVYCLRTVKIQMCIVHFYDRNFESKTCTGCLRYSHRLHVIAVYSERGGVRTKSWLSCSRSCRYVINDPVSMSFIIIFLNHILLSLWK